jgi:Zn-dependent M32 family carboxypeptidase
MSSAMLHAAAGGSLMMSSADHSLQYPISQYHCVSLVLISRWDEMVMMPPGAAASRATQKAALAGILYDKQTSPELGELLERLRDVAASHGFDPFQRAVIREARRQDILWTHIGLLWIARRKSQL